MDLDQTLLVIGSRCGLIEILQPNSLLTCLQRFSIMNSTLPVVSGSIFHLTGLCLAPRPDWLSLKILVNDSTRPTSKSMESGDCNAELDKFCSMKSLNRHFGWFFEDTMRVRPNKFVQVGVCEE